jgi:hypothetical protein
VNYPKLSTIKQKYDPNMVFWATPGINADYMRVVNGRVCRVNTAADVKVAPLTDNGNAPKRVMGGRENNPDQVPVAGAGKTPAKPCGAGDGEYVPGVPGSPVGQVGKTI